MIPDNIQANIMKYLNNGVSGSSQPQKPVVSGTIYDFQTRFFNTSNAYVTEDNQYIVTMGVGYNNSQSYYAIQVYDIENTIKEKPTPAMTFAIPSYMGAEGSPSDFINRDEEGRFYTIIHYTINNVYTSFLVLFNDFITDGIIQINEAYNLNEINVTTDIYRQQTLSSFDRAIKLKGKGEYIFFTYKELGGRQIGQWAGQYAFYVAKMIVSVGEGIKTKAWKFNIKNETDDQYLGWQKMSINTDSDIPFILIQYFTTSNVEGNPPTQYRIIPTNYAVGKIFLEEDPNNDFTTTTIKNIYTINDYISCSDFEDRAYLTNGLYIQDIVLKYTNNVVSLKYLFITPSGVVENINFPTTFIITNFDNNNISISDTFITLGLFGDTDYTQLYKIDRNNNRLIYIDELTGISTSQIGILRQFNLYYCFSFLLFPKVFLVKDVPTYGRDCLLKQKLLNSKLFRLIKKHRSRHTNI